MEQDSYITKRQFWKNSNLSCVLEYRKEQIPYPPHSHDFYELVIVLDGNGLHESQYNSINLEKGNIFIICPSQVHSFKSTKKLELMNVLISPDFFENDSFGLTQIKGFRSLVNHNNIEYFRLKDFELIEVKNKIDKMQKEMDKELQGYIPLQTAYLMELFIYLLRAVNDTGTDSSNNKFSFFRLKRYVEEHYLEKITIEDLTQLSGLSESSILRRFKQNTGYSPLEYQLHLKLLEASRALIQTDESITDIAWNTGFSDSNYFCRYFKKNFNLSPRDYRKLYRT